MIEIDNIKPEHLTQTTLTKACASIWYLEVNVTEGWLIENPNLDYTWRRAGSTECGHGLVRLLKATSNLKELGLQFVDYRPSNPSANPEDPRRTSRKGYGDFCFKNVTENVQLNHLTKLKLEGLSTHTAHLLSLLTQCQSSLRSIKLSDVYLVGDADEGSEHWPWTSIFKALCEDCQDLEYLLLYHLGGFHAGVGLLEDPFRPSAPRQTNDAHMNPSFIVYVQGYEHAPVQARGKAAVYTKLQSIIEQYWYYSKDNAYTRMDDELWYVETLSKLPTGLPADWCVYNDFRHTDTSDEGW